MSNSVLRRLKLVIGSLERSRPTTRLGEFSFDGRRGPVLVLAVVGAAMYLIDGFSSSLRIFLQLCAAFAVAFLLLYCLGKIKGLNASWRWIVPAAVAGAALGGLVSALIALAPEWAESMSNGRFLLEWQTGAAFSAFFVGLALVTSAVRQSEQTEIETRQRVLEARLKMLSARIEPHFLMNSLANLRYLIRSDPATAYEMLDHLSEFLQAALERSRDLATTLGQEAQLVESYLRIMQIRLGDKLTYTIDVPERLRPAELPALLLQTLVENAVAHGIEPLAGTGHIGIQAIEEADSIRITVSDDGTGLGQGGVQPGIGLRNVEDRLGTFYRGRAAFSIAARGGGGTVAAVTIPRKAA